jgi:D-alanyl-D-alanine carboxypeptidase (penicillin-binding protein 5/6)
MASITFEGGHSFIGFAESDGLSLIVVVLGSDVIMFEDDSAEMRNLTESRRLFEWGFSQFSWRTILSTSDLVDRAPVSHGAGADFVNLRPESEVRLLLDNDIPDEEFIRTVTIYSVENDEELFAPIEAGEVLGELTLTRDGIVYGTIFLVANTNIDLHRFEFIRMQIREILTNEIVQIVFWGLIALLALYTALVIRYNILRQRRLRRIRIAKKKLAQERRQALELEEDESEQITRTIPSTTPRLR